MTNGFAKDGLSPEDLAWRVQARTALQERRYAELDALLAPHELAWLQGENALPGIRWRLRNLHDATLTLELSLIHI